MTDPGVRRVRVPPNPSRGALSRRTVWAETEYGSWGPKVPTAPSLPSWPFVPHSGRGLTSTVERVVCLSLLLMNEGAVGRRGKVEELLVKLPW